MSNSNLLRTLKKNVYQCLKESSGVRWILFSSLWAMVMVVLFFCMYVIVCAQAGASAQQGTVLVWTRRRGPLLILLIQNTLFLARPWLAWFQVTKPFAKWKRNLTSARALGATYVLRVHASSMNNQLRICILIKFCDFLQFLMSLFEIGSISMEDWRYVIILLRVLRSIRQY